MKKMMVVLLFCIPGFARDAFVHSSSQFNGALLVGVANGLQGIGIDIDFMKEMLGRGYNISHEVIRDSQGTPEKVAEALTRFSREYSGTGSLLFYYSGHGHVGLINTHQKNMMVAQIRDAIKAGISLMGPIKRLTLIFDSCRSGSLVDPFQTDRASEEMADHVAEVFMETRNSTSYWEELFILTSARASENCGASATGSAFTKAFKKAFDEVASTRGTVREFMTKTSNYTQGSHPTYRLVPESIAEEELVPSTYSASSGGSAGNSTWVQ